MIYCCRKSVSFPYSRHRNLLSNTNKGNVVSRFYVDSLENVYLAICGMGEFSINTKGALQWNSKRSCYYIDERLHDMLLYSYGLTGKDSFGSFKIIDQQAVNTDTLLMTLTINNGQARFYALRLNKEKLIFSIKNLLFEKACLKNYTSRCVLCDLQII